MGIRNTQSIIEKLAPSKFFDNDACFYGTGREVANVHDVSDANAHLWKTDFLAGGVTHVPVHVYGIGIADTDLGFFNGETEPQVAVVDAALTSWVKLGFQAAGEPAIQIGGSATTLYLPDIQATMITIYAAENFLYFTESDQTDPAGRWRFRVNNDIMYLEHALTASWATDEDWESHDYANALTTVSKKRQFGVFGDTTGLSTGTTGQAVAIYAEVPSGVTVADTVRALRSRMLVNQAQTADCSIFGVEGNARIKANLGQGVHAGLWGYFEQSGTVTLASPGINAGGVFAVETAGATFTLSDGAYLSGAVLSSNVNASAGITAASNFQALWIRTAASCKEWNEIIVVTTLTAKDVTIVELATEAASFKWDESEDSFRLTDGLMLDASTQQSATEVYIVHDNAGDLTVNAKSGKTVNVAIAGADEYVFAAASLDMNSNHLDNCGYIVLNAITWVTGETGIWNESTGELHLNAITGKTIKFEIADVEEMQLSGSDLKVDVINELTSGVGVTIEGVLLKDSNVEFANATLPATTITYIGRDNTGDLTIHTIVNKAINLAIVGADVLRVEGAKISLLQDIFTDRWASLDSNVMLGMDVCGGDAITSAHENVVIGYQAGYSLTVCSESVIIGYQANYTGTTQGKNVVIGYKAFYSATYDYDTVAIGNSALEDVADGNCGNTAVGADAGGNLTTGGDNVFIGHKAGQSSNMTTASDCICIGQRTYPAAAATDGYIQIGRYSTRAALLSDNDGDWEIKAQSGKTIDLKIGSTDEYEFGATAADFNGNNITALGTLGTTGAITIAPTAAGTFLDFVLETEWVSGTLINMDFASSTTLSSAAIFINIDCSNILATSEQSVKTIDIALPTMTVDNASPTVEGVEISGGAIVQTTGGTTTWNGVDITMPNVTQTAGTITATAIPITGGTITTGGAVKGIKFVSGAFTTGIDLAGAAIVVDSGRDNAYWSIGTYGSPVTVSVSDNFLMTQINVVNDGTVLASSKKLVGFYVNATTGADQGTYGRLKGIESYIVVKHALADGHCVYGELYYDASVTGITNEGLGVGGTVDTTGCSGEPTGLLYAGKFRIKGDNLRSASYGHLAMFIVTESSTHTNTCIENLGGATVTNMLWLKNDQTAANGLFMSGTITNAIVLAGDGTKATIIGTSGEYTRFGDAAETQISLATEDDVMVTGKFEGYGVGYFNSVLFVGDANVTNTFMTTGITIDQGAAANEILSFKQTGVAHGITDLAETNTYGTMRVQATTVGGLRISGFTEATAALNLDVVGTTDSTVKTTAATGYINLITSKKVGTGDTNPGADANLVVIAGRLVTKFIFDQDGDFHCTDVVCGLGEGGVTALTGGEIRAPNLVTGAGADDVNGCDLTVSPGLGRGAGTLGKVIINGSVAAVADTVQTLSALLTLQGTSAIFADAATIEIGDTGAIQTGIAADDYFTLNAYDSTGSTRVGMEAIRIANNTAVTAKIGFFGQTPAVQQTGTAVVNEAYAGTGDLDEESEIAAAFNAQGAAINLLRTAVNNLGLTTTV